MKLKEFRVREFRCIWDSGPIKVDDRITCLVGKNEAGKSALLSALYRTNPIVPADNVFDLIYDYPKREVEDYRFDIENGERDDIVVVECQYELEEQDLQSISLVFGTKVLKSRMCSRRSFYGVNKSKITLDVDEVAARHHFLNNQALPGELRQVLASAVDWSTFASALDAAESTETVVSLRHLVKKIRQDGLATYLFTEFIWPHAPKYLYFDEYYQLSGQANLNELIAREDSNSLLNSDHPLLGLINLARLDHHELVQTKNTIELKNKLEGAGNFLTKRIVKYWSQNQHIKMKLDVRDGKPDDPKGMRDGINVWGEVYDTVHLSHMPLGSRSRGFVWFFSFLAWYEDVKRRKQAVILLFDEPGLSLHGRAQVDLLKYFETELVNNQLLYTTHSPFMIDPQKIDRVRVIQDRGTETSEILPKEQDGTKVVTNVFDATDDSLFPLQGALGYQIQKTLCAGSHTLIVESPVDMLYLQAISAQFEREGRVGLSEEWILTPVGGSANVPAFVALIIPHENMVVASLLGLRNDNQVLVDNVYKKRIINMRYNATYADFTGESESDIEDMFDREFYSSLVNAEFRKELVNPISHTVLNPGEPRIVPAIKAYLAVNPLRHGSFGRYRPARLFSEKFVSLWPHISNGTKDRFEAIFNHFNTHLQR